MPTRKSMNSKDILLEILSIGKVNGSGLLNKFRLEKQIALLNFIVIFNSHIALDLDNDVSLKFSKFQKHIFLFLLEPKNERNYFLISALASKNGSNKKN